MAEKITWSDELMGIIPETLEASNTVSMLSGDTKYSKGRVRKQAKEDAWNDLIRKDIHEGKLTPIPDTRHLTGRNELYRKIYDRTFNREYNRVDNIERRTSAKTARSLAAIEGIRKGDSQLFNRAILAKRDNEDLPLVMGMIGTATLPMTIADMAALGISGGARAVGQVGKDIFDTVSAPYNPRLWGEAASYWAKKSPYLVSKGVPEFARDFGRAAGAAADAYFLKHTASDLGYRIPKNLRGDFEVSDVPAYVFDAMGVAGGAGLVKDALPTLNRAASTLNDFAHKRYYWNKFKTENQKRIELENEQQFLKNPRYEPADPSGDTAVFEPSDDVFYNNYEAFDKYKSGKRLFEESIINSIPTEHSVKVKSGSSGERTIPVEYTDLNGNRLFEDIQTESDGEKTGTVIGTVRIPTIASTSLRVDLHSPFTGGLDFYKSHNPKSDVSVQKQKDFEILQNRLGDRGVVAGSYSILHDKGSLRNPDDVEILISSKDIPAIEKEFGVSFKTAKVGQAGNYTFDSGVKGINKKVEFEVLKEGPNGGTIGTNAEECYFYLDPLGFRDALQNVWNTRKPMEVPLSPEELVSAMRNSPDAMKKKVLIDNMKSGKGKHNMRVFAVTKQEPKLVGDLVDNIGTAYFGSEFTQRQSEAIKNIDFSNTKANSEFLKKLSLPQSWAEDPEIMKTIYKLWRYQNSTVTRGIEDDNLSLEKFTERLLQSVGNYSGRGAGGNTEQNSKYGGGETYTRGGIGMIHIPLSYNESQFTSVMDGYNQVKRQNKEYSLSDAEKRIAYEVTGNPLFLDEDNLQFALLEYQRELLSQSRDDFKSASDKMTELGKALDIPAIRTEYSKEAYNLDNAYNIDSGDLGTYVGNLSEKPLYTYTRYDTGKPSLEPGGIFTNRPSDSRPTKDKSVYIPFDKDYREGILSKLAVPEEKEVVKMFFDDIDNAESDLVKRIEDTIETFGKDYLLRHPEDTDAKLALYYDTKKQIENRLKSIEKELQQIEKNKDKYRKLSDIEEDVVNTLTIGILSALGVSTIGIPAAVYTIDSDKMKDYDGSADFQQNMKTLLESYGVDNYYDLPKRVRNTVDSDYTFRNRFKSYQAIKKQANEGSEEFADGGKLITAVTPKAANLSSNLRNRLNRLYNIDDTDYSNITADKSNLFYNGGNPDSAGVLNVIKNKLVKAFRTPIDWSSKEAGTNNCAEYSNNVVADIIGTRPYGHAWTRTNNPVDKVISGYDGLTKPSEYSRKAAMKYLYDAADNVRKNIRYRDLQDGDLVGMYYRGSENQQNAFENGVNGEVQSHTGHIVRKFGIPFVEHNVHGDVKLNNARKVVGSNRPYGIVSVYRMKDTDKKSK